jgi:hypothetical protein
MMVHLCGRMSEMNRIEYTSDIVSRDVVLESFPTV